MLKEFFINTGNVLIEWHRKETTKYVPKTHGLRGLFDLEFSFQNGFCELFNTSGFSQICKIKNVWNLTSPFTSNTRIPSSKNTSWSLKTTFWK
jgi:hypothetical protein